MYSRTVQQVILLKPASGYREMENTYISEWAYLVGVSSGPFLQLISTLPPSSQHYLSLVSLMNKVRCCGHRVSVGNMLSSTKAVR